MRALGDVAAEVERGRGSFSPELRVEVDIADAAAAEAKTAAADIGGEGGVVGGALEPRVGAETSAEAPSQRGDELGESPEVEVIDP